MGLFLKLTNYILYLCLLFYIYVYYLGVVHDTSFEYKLNDQFVIL